MYKTLMSEMKNFLWPLWALCGPSSHQLMITAPHQKH